MRNRRLSEKITALLLTLMMPMHLSGNVVKAYAEDGQETEDKEQIERPGMGFIDMGYRAPLVGDVSFSGMQLYGNNSIPAEYDSRDYGYLTAVKSQGSLGTCWSFAAVASMEAYAVSHGLVDSADDIDLSEYALASLTFNDSSFVDDTGTADDDDTTTTNMRENMLNGGNDNYAFKTLTKWAGVMNEEDAMYDSTGNTVVQYDADKISYILTNQYFINMTDSDHVKRAIMENGAVASYYNANEEYSVSVTGYPEYYHYTYEETYSNHAIAIVGWDDTISKDNFTISAGGQEYTPTADGAWLIKNSWGTYYGDDGYMWISYEDKTLLDATACVYEIAPRSTYKRNYQHDGSNIFSYNVRWDGITKYANVFDVAGNNEQLIKAVAFAIEDANREYSVQIYLNPQTDRPESGTALLDEPLTGSIVYAGYYTIPLAEPVTVNPGDTFSVVVSFDRSTSVSAAVNQPFNIQGGSSCIAVNTCGDNQSYIISGSSATDTYNYGSSSYSQVNFCIKAFTDEVGNSITPSEIISITPDSLDALTVSWQRVTGVSEYELLRAESQNGIYTTVYTGNGLTYRDENVELNKTYYYKIRVYDGQEPLDSPVESYILKLPAATISSVTSDNTGITITWNRLSEVDGYRIYRSEDGANYDEIATMTDTYSYKDTSVRYNTTFYYMIKTYHVKNGVTYVSDAGNAITGVKKVGIPEDFKVVSSDVGKVNLGWNGISYAKGYTIYRSFTYADGTKITEQKIADVGAGVTSYTADISDLEEGGTVTFYIKAYDTESGMKVYSEKTATSIYIKFKPIDNIRWYVSGGNIYVIWDKYECNSITVSGYNLFGYNDKTTNSITASRSSSLERVVISSYVPTNEYYVTVQAKNAMGNFFTHPQNPRVKIGGAYKPISLKTINDVKCDKGNTVVLQATLTDVMENFDYSYQWYEASGRTGQGTKISGATGSTYSPDTSSYGKKYYYCVVSGTYNGTKTGSTNVVMVQTDRDMSECVVSSVNDQVYTGKNITPTVTVTYKGTKLTAGTDYTVTYTNNVNAGTATITIVGKGAYTGTITKNFVIYKDIPITLKAINDVKCDKGSKVVLQAIMTEVMANCKYTYQWYEASSRTGQGTKISGATGSTYSPDTSSYGKKYYYCVVSGTYNGTKTGSTNVVMVQTDRDMSECVTASISNQIYTGKTITPSVTVTYKGTKLTAGTDYTVAYSNNINAGTATVTITGKGAYSGTVSRNFVIYKDIPDKITSQSVSVNQSSSIISKITVGTKVSDILNKIDQKKYVAVYNGNTRVSSDTLVATGMKVVISDGNNIKKQYTIIVTGDVNGDGKINVADMMSVKSHILKKSTLAGNWYSAADVNGDAKINVADFMSVKGYILKKNNIPGIAVK